MKMHTTDDLFTTKTEIPEIVQSRANAAFSSIKMEEAEMSKKKKSFFKRPAAVATAAAVVVLAAGTAFAAANGFWSSALNGILPEDVVSQQALESQGYMARFEENSSNGLSTVTDAGVSITPVDVICDGTYGYIVFSVEGFEIEDEEEPNVGGLSLYTGNDRINGGVSGGGNFYPGYTLTEERLDHYDNGDPMEWKDEDHLLYLPKYYNEDGQLEYVVYFHENPNAESLIGKNLHVSFDGLGISSGKAEMEVTVPGEWNFDITLPGNDSTRTISLKEKVEGSDYILDTVEISPLSVKAHFTYDGTERGTNDADLIPFITGVCMEGGSWWIPSGGGSSGFSDETRTNAFGFDGFGKVLDPDSITSIRFSCNPNPGESTVAVIDLD